jgi:hypothetical protein
MNQLGVFFEQYQRKNGLSNADLREKLGEELFSDFSRFDNRYLVPSPISLRILTAIAERLGVNIATLVGKAYRREAPKPVSVFSDGLFPTKRPPFLIKLFRLYEDGLVSDEDLRIIGKTVEDLMVERNNRDINQSGAIA